MTNTMLLNEVFVHIDHACMDTKLQITEDQSDRKIFYDRLTKFR